MNSKMPHKRFVSVGEKAGNEKLVVSTCFFMQIKLTTVIPFQFMGLFFVLYNLRMGENKVSNLTKKPEIIIFFSLLCYSIAICNSRA